MALLRLPQELLDHIINLSLPDDFENFLLSCRTIYEAGRPQLAAHRQRRREWSKLELDSFEDGVSTVLFLHKIAGDPIIARYIRSVDLRGKIARSGPGNQKQPPAAFERLKGDQALIDELVAFIDASPVASGNDRLIGDLVAQIHQYTSRAYDNSAAICTVLLLTLFTDVHKLTLPMVRDWLATDLPNTDILVLEKMMRLSRGQNPSGPLSTLRELRMLAPLEYDTRIALRSLCPLLALNSLEELYATSCVAVDDGYTGIPFTWPYPDIQSSLRSIEFLGCCMDASQLSRLLAHTPYLTSFKYDHATKWHGCECDWDAGAFVAAIGKHCGHQLTTLAITASGIFEEMITGVVSLKEFVRLESAELEITIFAGPSPESGERAGIDSCEPSPGFKAWEPAMVPKLTEILPPSLRTLHLFDPLENDHSDVSCALLKDFSAGRDWLLSELEEASFCQRISADPEPDKMKDIRAKVMNAVKAAGIEYRFGTAVMPRWRRAFAHKCGLLEDRE